MKWFRKAAEQGYAEAQYSLGIMYANGRGVPQDDVEATKWYRKAAEQGYAWAQIILGIRYAGGYGVSRDDVLAYKWFALCTAGSTPRSDDHNEASKWMDTLAKRMTSAQIARAKQEASDWIATHARAQRLQRPGSN